MILTVTPNAAVDKTYRVEGFRLDVVNRPSQTFTVAGGKGIGKQILHALKAIAGGGGKTVEKGVLVVEHGQVGGKAGHGGSR